MGVLSRNAGVLGGIGDAMRQNSANKREERLAALQHERQQAIIKMQQEFSAGENQKQRDLTVSEGGKDRQVQVGGQMRTDDRAREERESREREGGKDRASREKIAGMNADARRAAAAGKGSNKRFTIKAVTNADLKAGTQTQDIVLTDNQSGRTFKQVNDIFLPQGAQPPQKRAPGGAISALLDDPKRADEFIRFYGYLPIEFFNAANETGGASADDVTDEEE